MITRVEKIMIQAVQKTIKEIRYISPASRPRKILFDHLPKCGGSSLSRYLGDHYPKRKTFSINGSDPAASIEEFKTLSQRKRHGYDLIKGHLAYNLLDYVHPECIKITVFREPIDRMISHYYYAKRSPKHYLYSRIHEYEMSLEDYVTSDLSGELRNWYTTRFSGLTVDEAERRPAESIKIAVEVVLKRYDIIGFLDNFSLFTEMLRERAKLRYKYQGIKVNVTENRPYLNDIPQSTISIIEQVNHLDITFYNKIKSSEG